MTDESGAIKEVVLNAEMFARADYLCNNISDGDERDRLKKIFQEAIVRQLRIASRMVSEQIDGK